MEKPAEQPQKPLEEKAENTVDKKPQDEPKATTHAEESKPQKAETAKEDMQTANETTEESKIFTLKSEKKLAPKVNVLGKIDLDSLNQSTRPKKKSKEERRKSARKRPHRHTRRARRSAHA